MKVGRIRATLAHLDSLTASLERYEKALAYENYHGTVCKDCGWDASCQPPEVHECLVCRGELVDQYLAAALRSALEGVK